MACSGASADEGVVEVVEWARGSGPEVTVSVVHEVGGELGISPAGKEVVGDL